MTPPKANRRGPAPDIHADAYRIAEPGAPGSYRGRGRQLLQRALASRRQLAELLVLGDVIAERPTPLAALLARTPIGPGHAPPPAGPSPTLPSTPPGRATTTPGHAPAGPGEASAARDRAETAPLYAQTPAAPDAPRPAHVSPGARAPARMETISGYAPAAPTRDDATSEHQPTVRVPTSLAPPRTAAPHPPADAASEHQPTVRVPTSLAPPLPTPALRREDTLSEQAAGTEREPAAFDHRPTVRTAPPPSVEPATTPEPEFAAFDHDPTVRTAPPASDTLAERATTAPGYAPASPGQPSDEETITSPTPDRDDG